MCRWHALRGSETFQWRKSKKQKDGREHPFGLEGGEAGRVGKNFGRRKDATVEKLEGCDPTALMQAKPSSSKRPARVATDNRIDAGHR
jgi:N-methylhydantoinase B/oxoprolinase/acetone carboxylase alpha subunit